MAIFHRARQSSGDANATTIVAPGTRIQGNLVSGGGVHVDGEVIGNVEAATYIIVTEGAIVRGDLHAQEVYLGGLVTGDIWAIEAHLYGVGLCDGTIEAIRIHQERKE